MKKLGYLSAFILPILLVSGYYLGGWWNLLTAAFVFIIEPSWDTLSGKDPENVSEEREKEIAADGYYRFVTYAWVVVQVTLLTWCCFAVVSGKLSLWYEWAGFILGTALVTGGIGITVAHELGHKKDGLRRFFSKLLLLTVGYMHFYIEHNRGHHVKVATLEDPATARKGESFYAFWVRSVFLGYLSAWKIENTRMQKKGWSRFSINNEMIWFLILPVILWLAITLGFSLFLGRFAFEVFYFLPVQAFLAFSLLELVNYIEHYGILRKEMAPGRYERVNPLHSWNANHKLSNFFLFQLQRHSDHHAFAAKPYQILKHYDESPQLPAGYPTMIIIAMFPPLWFSMMDHRLEDWKLTLA